MSKKAFHPGSFANQHRIQEAEARAEAKRKHDEETLAQYQKEQELLYQRSLISKESKDKLSLSFMYDAPASCSKQEDKEEEFKGDKAEIKWKRERPKVKKELKEEGAVKKSGESNLKRPKDDSDDEEPKIELKWKRDKPRAKKADSKRIKEERS